MSIRPYVDEIFAALVIDRGVDTDLLTQDLQNRFVTCHYPSKGVVGGKVWCIPPDFPQFKGKLSVKNEVWFERIYLDGDSGHRAWLETRPTGAWLYVEDAFSDEERSAAIGKPASDFVRRRPFPDHILITEAANNGARDYDLTRFAITQPEMVPLPHRSTIEGPPDDQDQSPILIDETGQTYPNLETFLSLTHVLTAPWVELLYYWKRDGIRIESHEVAHIDLVHHKTPGLSNPISAISIKTPYNPEKVSEVGPAPRTFFDRANSAWMIPMPISPVLAGRILSIWSVIVLPDGRFFRSRV